jgi:hypothetical protein
LHATRSANSSTALDERRQVVAARFSASEIDWMPKMRVSSAALLASGSSTKMRLCESRIRGSMLSLRTCRLLNTDDQVSAKGSGARYLLGDEAEA